MKGLLIKDFMLMKTQINFFLIIAFLSVCMTAFQEDTSFIISYLTFIGAIFSLTTISYDEFDNGNVFLFSLPISRKGYVAEKYGFGLLVGGGSWLLSLLLAMIAGAAKNTLQIKDLILTALMILPVMLVILAVTLPFYFKFGGEMGRIAIIAGVGLLFAAGFLIVKAANAMNIDLISIINHLSGADMGILAAAALVVSGFLLLLSCRISMSIMDRKEF